MDVSVADGINTTLFANLTQHRHSHWKYGSQRRLAKFCKICRVNAVACVCLLCRLPRFCGAAVALCNRANAPNLATFVQHPQATTTPFSRY